MEKNKYKHLSIEERELISQLLASGKTLGEIAKSIGRNKSSISREVSRNFHRVKKKYFAHNAQIKYKNRKFNAKKYKRLLNPIVRSYVVDKIKVGWSPEQISGRIKRDLPGQSISHEAIYQFIYDPIARVHIDLVQYLRRNHKKRVKKSYLRRSKRSNISNRMPIESRPQEVEERKVLGHWEGDSVVSMKSKVGLNTIVERKSRFVLISKLNDKTAEETKKAVVLRLGTFPPSLRKTLTLDNGSENAYHQKITEQIGTKCYFANPYHSWERGTNENTNGLIRWYLPKGTDFANVSEADIRNIEWLLNTRPRKTLNYKTPIEVLTERDIA